MLSRVYSPPLTTTLCDSPEPAGEGSACTMRTSPVMSPMVAPPSGRKNDYISLASAPIASSRRRSCESESDHSAASTSSSRRRRQSLAKSDSQNRLEAYGDTRRRPSNGVVNTSNSLYNDINSHSTKSSGGNRIKDDVDQLREAVSVARADIRHAHMCETKDNLILSSLFGKFKMSVNQQAIVQESYLI